ncbi:MAG: hypothetical protein WED05_02615 [Candidatus Atabeyarchaeum deiterrae]
MNASKKRKTKKKKLQEETRFWWLSSIVGALALLSSLYSFAGTIYYVSTGIVLPLLGSLFMTLPMMVESFGSKLVLIFYLGTAGIGLLLFVYSVWKYNLLSHNRSESFWKSMVWGFYKWLGGWIIPLIALGVWTTFLG